MNTRTKITLELTLEELDEFRNARAVLEKENSALNLKLQNAYAKDPSGQIAELLAAVRAALPCVQYAVANLDSTTPRWPHGALADFADRLRHIPGLSVNEHEVSTQFAQHAKECALADRARVLAKVELDRLAQELGDDEPSAPKEDPAQAHAEQPERAERDPGPPTLAFP